MMKSSLGPVALIASLLFAACGGSPDGGGGMAGNGSGNGEGTAAASSPLKSAIQIPNDVVLGAQVSANAVVWGVYTASVQAGGGVQIVKTGTVTEQAPGQWVYSASPSDKLVLKPASGKPLEATEIDLYGNPQSPDAFFASDHRISYSAKVEGLGEMKVQRVVQNRATQGSATGTFDFKSAGSTYFDNDSTGSEYRNEERVTGVAKGDDFELTVDESWTFRSITASKSGTATEAIRKSANALKLGGDSYASACSFQKSFTKGKPSQLDTYWKAQGGMEKNGQTFGVCKMDSQAFGQSGGQIRFVLALATGEVIELEKWNAY
jgi:hypothetical protein